MSPAPFNNEPRRQLDGEDDMDDLGPMDQFPIPVISDSSDVDSAEETVQPTDAVDDSAEAMGYQLLPQDLTNSNENDDGHETGDNDDDSDDDEKHEAIVSGDAVDMDNITDENTIGFEVLLPAHLQMRSTPESIERREVWNCNDSSSKDIPVMDTEHAEKIKTIMVGITLPSAHVPPWVGVVPEEEWKARLLSKIHQSP